MVTRALINPVKEGNNSSLLTTFQLFLIICKNRSNLFKIQLYRNFKMYRKIICLLKLVHPQLNLDQLVHYDISLESKSLILLSWRFMQSYPSFSLFLCPLKTTKMCWQNHRGKNNFQISKKNQKKVKIWYLGKKWKSEKNENRGKNLKISKSAN